MQENCRSRVQAMYLFQWLEKEGHQIVLWSDIIDASWCKNEKFDLVLSYTYRFIVKKEIIDLFHGNIVNIHNSYLPWNRGADPNIWSILEETPRGVTLHYIDENLDKGDIIAQKIVIDGENETLSTTYNNLDRAAKELFKEAFRYYKFWPDMKKKVVGKGSYHSAEKGNYIKEKIDSYDISIDELKGMNFQ